MSGLYSYAYIAVSRMQLLGLTFFHCELEVTRQQGTPVSMKGIAIESMFVDHESVCRHSARYTFCELYIANVLGLLDL